MSRIGFAILVTGLLAIATAAAAAVVHRAYGHGRITIPDESVSFSAVSREDGSASGRAVVHDYSARVTAEIEVDCLNVIGNVAIISGKVTRSSERAIVGFQGIFEVVDNDTAAGGDGDHQGDGDDGLPDLMSPVNFYAFGTGPDCTVPAEYDLQPIRQGNIEVR